MLRYKVLAGLGLLALVGLACLPAGCDRGGSSAVPLIPDEPEPKIDVPEADLKELLAGNNQFAIELFKKIAEKETGNIVISPYSISSALAMVYAGARGETAEEMKRVMHFTLPSERLHAAFYCLNSRMQNYGNHKQISFEVANAIWTHKDVSLQPDFLNLCRRYYKVDPKNTVLDGNSLNATAEINKWLGSHTNNKIIDLLSDRDLPLSSQQIILMNTVYFQGDWKMPFDSYRTHSALFMKENGTPSFAKMMERNDLRAMYFSSEEFQMLEIPYSSSDFMIIFYLPHTKNGIRQLENSLNMSMLENSISNLSLHSGTVSMPILSMKMRLFLHNHLKLLGMNVAFSDNCNFDGLSLGNKLYLDSPVHGTFLEINELGTEAAAATAIPLTTSELPHMDWRADHPFLFMILDKQTHTALFMGRVNDP